MWHIRIPSFSNQGTDGTIKDVVFTVDEEQYTAESDITTKPVKTFDTAGPIFGINEGDELTTQVLSINLPKTWYWISWRQVKLQPALM